MFLGVCGCCKQVTPCTHIQFWQGIKSDQEFKLSFNPSKNLCDNPPVHISNEERNKLLSGEFAKEKNEKNAKRRQATAASNQSQPSSDLLGNAKEQE